MRKGVWLGGTALIDPSTYDGRGNGNAATDSTNLSSWHWYPETGLGSFASLPFSNWAPNQPDRSGAQHCLSMWTPPHVFAFQWRDRNCALQEAFVCEDARAPTGTGSAFAARVTAKGADIGLLASAARVPSMPPVSSLPAASSSIISAEAGNVLGVHAAAGSSLGANVLWIGFLLGLVLCALCVCLVHNRRRQRQRALRTSTSDTLPVMKPTESMRFEEPSIPPPLEAVKSHEEDLGSKMIAALAGGVANGEAKRYPRSPFNDSDRMADGTELPVYETQRVWLDKKLEHGVQIGLDSPMRYGQ